MLTEHIQRGFEDKSTSTEEQTSLATSMRRRELSISTKIICNVTLTNSVPKNEEPNESYVMSKPCYLHLRSLVLRELNNHPHWSTTDDVENASKEGKHR